MEKLSAEQRNALTTFVKHIRELLRICAHGGVPLEADEFIEQYLTSGQLRAMCQLFQEPDDSTVSGYCGPVRFPGSVVDDCNPFVRELARPWIPYRVYDASPSDVAFLTPAEEQNRAFAFRKLNEYASALENVLQNEVASGSEIAVTSKAEGKGRFSEKFLAAFESPEAQAARRELVKTLQEVIPKENRNLKTPFSPMPIDTLAKFADHAFQFAKTIRDWLPVTGDASNKFHNSKTADHWFQYAAGQYIECERIRNPQKLPFHQRGGFYHGPSDAGPFWLEICYAMDSIADLYQWQGLSDETSIPCSSLWQECLPAVDGTTLARLERGTAGLKGLIAQPDLAAEISFVEHFARGNVKDVTAGNITCHPPCNQKSSSSSGLRQNQLLQDGVFY